ncbi:MAG: peptidoglycan-binding domain-containing protein [Sarcina sp.]
MSNGICGQETLNVVKEFQRTHGLFVDGIVGNQTMEKLDEEVKLYEEIHQIKPPVTPGDSGTVIGPITQNDLFNTLHALYNVGIGGVEQRNKDVLNYLRQSRYGSTDTSSSVVWNALVLPNFLYNSRVDANLEAQASTFTGSYTINIYGSEIGIPHLSITTLCYDLSAIKEILIPSFWTGWGGDLSTLLGQVIYYSSTLNNTSATFKNDIYKYAYNLVGGNNSISSFGLSNVYEDIDAIYFANHISEKPIDSLKQVYEMETIFLIKK